MKRIFLSILAVVGLLTACNMSEVESVNHSGDRIDFFVTTGGMTKAVDVTTANLTGFTVEAFNHNTVVEPYMNAVAFTGGNGTFASATPYYWPQGALDFYAYSQGAAEGQVQKSDYRTFTVTPSPTPVNQVDFVFAGTTNKTKGNSTSGAIALNFRHTESKVVVKVKNTAPNLKFVISDWKLGYLDDAGTFTYNANETNPYDATTDGTGTLNIGMWSNNADAAATKGYTNTLASSVNVAANASEALLDGEMIVIPQSVTAASAHAEATAGSAVNGSYVGLKLKILNRENDSVIYSDGNNTAWAIWPANFAFEPGKKYTFTVDLCGGGYYETNHDANTDLDPILEGAVISFANVTVDDFSSQSSEELSAPVTMSINADCNPGYVGDDIEFTVQLPADATGNVSFQIRNVEGVEVNTQINLTNGRGTYLAIGGLVAGPHTITAVYSGNSKYPGTTVSRIYTVEKLSSSVSIEQIADIQYGQRFLAKAHATDGATGSISIRVYNNSMSQEVTLPIDGSYAVAYFDNLPVGTYTVEATYLGDDKYKPSATFSETFEVLP